MTPHKTQLNNAFHKDLLLKTWSKGLKIGDRIYGAEEHLIYYGGNYYSIITQPYKDKHRVFYKYSQQLTRQDQVGEFSYRGYEILKFEGLIDKRYLIGDGVL